MNQQVQQSEHAAKMQQLLAKCWTDEAFKKQMLTNPMAAMKAEGVEPPAGLTIKVVENTDDVLYLTIPARSTSLSDDDLDKVAGGINIDGWVKTMRDNGWMHDYERPEAPPKDSFFL
jgi:hypothetical protein